MSRASGRLEAIDGLRAIAMTLVVAQHCKLAPFGWGGVWLFYVISGFVITRGFLHGGPQAPMTTYAAFLRRRFFRIVPVYLLYIAVNVLVMAAVHRTIGYRDIPFLLSFTFNWQMIFQLWPTPGGWSAFGHLWTLSVEEQFYIVFPFLFLLLGRATFVTIAMLLIAAGPFIRLAFSMWLATQPAAADPNWPAYAIYAGSFSQFDAFLMGAASAVFEPHLRSRPALRRTIYGTAIAALVLYVGTYGFLNLRGGATGADVPRNILSGILYGQGREVFVYSVVDLLCVAVVTLALTQVRVAHWLARPAFATVGRISYGAYLFHALILWLLGSYVMPAGFEDLPIRHRMVWFAIAWSMTVCLATLSFRWLEKPLMDWGAGTARPLRSASTTLAGKPNRA